MCWLHCSDSMKDVWFCSWCCYHLSSSCKARTCCSPALPLCQVFCSPSTPALVGKQLVCQKQSFHWLIEKAQHPFCSLERLLWLVVMVWLGFCSRALEEQLHSWSRELIVCLFGSWSLSHRGGSWSWIQGTLVQLGLVQGHKHSNARDGERDAVCKIPILQLSLSPSKLLGL